MNPKMKWLRNKLSSMNLQGMIVSNPVNIQYLTNIQAEGTLILTRKDNIYITDGRYIEYVNKTLTIFDEITVYDAKDLSQYDYENFFMYCENVGFEEDYLTYAKYKEYIRKFKINSLVETEAIIEKQRAIKDYDEIKNIEEACQITRNCFEYIQEFLKPGNTEKQVARLIDDYYYHHAQGPSFETIVASGENSSKPHAIPTDRVFTEQDIITIDMGCKYNGYCSDMTRTVAIGNITEKQAEVYNTVLKAQEEALKNIKANVICKEIDRISRNIIETAGYKGCFGHGLGHSVGIEIHESPAFNTRDETVLKSGTVITVEPGIYLENEFGVRIEDMVLITDTSYENLTKSPKELIII